MVWEHRKIARQCARIIEKLPPKVTKIQAKLLTPTNELALQLLRWVKTMKKLGRVGGALGEEIIALPSLIKQTLPRWFRCAWKLTKDENFCDDEMHTLIDQIAGKAPSVRAKSDARIEKMKQQLLSGLAPGTSVLNDPARIRKFEKQYAAHEGERRKYVRKQTWEAAKRVWREV
jgi:hypothetical protein